MRSAAGVRWGLLFCLVACAREGTEAALRARLGVPGDARRVIVFAQNAHLDIDWQKTFPGYYDAFVGQIFLEARGLLQAQPRARYSIAEMAFLQEHLRRHPEELAPLRALAASGALHVVGGGRTSPDTLLPETELIVRDYLLGSRFAEETLGAPVRAAWLPDSFGHSAAAPDLLAAAGFTSVFLGRVDGAPTLYEELAGKRARPLPGSTAAQLRDLGSADFFWRGPGGGRVLAHWQPHGIYCTGDDLDYDEPLQIPGGHVGPFRGDSPGFVDARIDGYLAALAPYARTPYLFVPVGCDFQHPKENLLKYLDGYNARHPGVFAVAAGFDDYAALVQQHAAALPELAADPTPYFTGFLGSRAEVKRSVREAARAFFAAEPFAIVAGPELLDRAAFEELTLSDHHDFVTGTSADEVVAAEQLPLLQRDLAAGRAALQRVAEALSARIAPVPGSVARVLLLNPSGAVADALGELPVDGPVHAPGALVEALPAGRVRLFKAGLPPFSWTALDLLAGAEAAPAQVSFDGAVLSNGRVRAELRDGQLVSVRIDGQELLAGPSLLLRDYRDDGGLWRLGHEMPGCALTALAPPGAAALELREQSALRVVLALRGPDSVSELALQAGAAWLDLAVESGAAQGTTRTASFALAAPGPLLASLAGGFAERPADKLYQPTFWPAVSWAAAWPAALLLRQSTGARFQGGTLEVLVARDARSEACDLLGGQGSDTAVHRVEWRLGRAGSPAEAEQAAQLFNRRVEVLRVGGGAAGDLPPSASLLSVDGPAVITALKPAERGEGIIVRAQLLPGPARLQFGAAFTGLHALYTDTSERDLGAAPDATLLDRARTGPLTTLRFRP